MTQTPETMLVIAVDGPAASGKGTISKRLALHFGLAYLDTGEIYRAVGVKALETGVDPADPEAASAIAANLMAGDLNREDLRTQEAARAASIVAAHPGVRRALLQFQRDFAANPPAIAGTPSKGAVLDGRDIGTVICPEADAKIFVTAATDTRADRRWRERRSRGEAVDFADVLADIRARDARDSSRSSAPLKQADDADLLDTTELDIEAAVAQAIALVKARISAQ